MLKLFRYIDDFVFDVPRVGVQALANYMQYYFGVKPMTMARFFLIVQIAVVLALAYNIYQLVTLVTSLYVLCFVLAGVCCLLYLFWSSYEIEEVLETMVRNYRRVHEAFLISRLFQFVLITWSMLTDGKLGLLLLPLSSYLYFSAADLLPPSERYRWRKPVPEGV